MEKNKVKKSNPGSMLKQKTNEDFNKQEPTKKEVSIKPDKTIPKTPKASRITTSEQREAPKTVYNDYHKADSYNMQKENVQRNINNTNSICKNRFS